uniref:hypothetical protein n=1 Tax=Pappia fissilis TaxID=1040649 RepID=UPI002A804712|nr:hypothetical protein UYP79_mgp045 [Pappia fissilis]WOX61291.1 hypothetical protein [Pappia fissilis]
MNKKYLFNCYWVSKKYLSWTCYRLSIKYSIFNILYSVNWIRDRFLYITIKNLLYSHTQGEGIRVKISLGFLSLSLGFLTLGFLTLGFLLALTLYTYPYLQLVDIYNNFFISKDIFIFILKFVFKYGLKLILILFRILIYVFQKIILLINQYIQKDLVKILRIEYSKSSIEGQIRLLLITFQTLTNEPLVKSIRNVYLELLNNENFKNFGSNKIIITSVITTTGELMLHRNILIKNDTTFEDFFNKIKEDLIKFDDPGYNQTGEVYTIFRVRVWNLDVYANKN